MMQAAIEVREETNKHIYEAGAREIMDGGQQLCAPRPWFSNITAAADATHDIRLKAATQLPLRMK